MENVDQLYLEIMQLFDISKYKMIFFYISGVTMREKKGGALQKLKKRLSHSFGRLSKIILLLFQFRFSV